MRRDRACKVIWNQFLKSAGYIDQRLIRLGLEEAGTQEDLDAFLKDWDINNSPIRIVVLVAYIMKSRPDLSFPSSISPRLNGIISYCRFRNLGMETSLREIMDTLNNNNIKNLILGDWAMRILRPDYPRWINNIDILVPEDGYDKAVEESIRIKKSVCVNVYQSPDDRISPEIIVFYYLLNLYDNLLSGQTAESLITTFADIKYLSSLKEGIDTELVWEDAKFYRKEFQVYLASKLVNSVVPGVFPEKWPGSYPASGRILRKRLVDFLFRKDALDRSGKIIKEGTRRGLIPSFIKYLIWFFLSGNKS